MRHIRGKSDLKQKLNFKLELDSPAESGLLTPQLSVISGHTAVTTHATAAPGVRCLFSPGPTGLQEGTALHQTPIPSLVCKVLF